MPGYTHLQRAQPVYLSHHLLAYFWMFRRDARRFEFVLGSTSELPLGAGALAGVNFATDRRLVARELGFAGVAPNSIDAVSNRDFVLDFLAAAATCATHLSRLGAEIVLWSSEEFGFCQVSDAWASGSSIMPQKKNPDAAELLRAKAPRVVGRPGRAARRAARPPADLQQGHAGGQGAPVRRRRHARPLPAGGRAGCSRRSRSTASGSPRAAADELIAATDIADLLVRRGVPFRQSHGIVAGHRARGARRRARRCRTSRARSSRATPTRSTTSSTTCSRSGRGSSPRCPRAARRSRACASSSATRARSSTASPRDAAALGRAGVLRPPGASRSRATWSAARSRTARTAGVIVETEAYHESEPACHAHVGLTRAHARAVRPAGHRLRLPLLRHPRAPQRGLRARGRRRGGADPRARAARRRSTRCASGAALHARRAALLGPGQAHAGARRSSSSSTAPTSRAGRCGSGRGRPAGRTSSSSTGHADRDHQGGRAAVALLRGRLAQRVAAVAARRCGARPPSRCGRGRCRRTRRRRLLRGRRRRLGRRRARGAGGAVRRRRGAGCRAPARGAGAAAGRRPARSCSGAGRRRRSARARRVPVDGAVGAGGGRSRSSSSLLVLGAVLLVARARASTNDFQIAAG